MHAVLGVLKGVTVPIQDPTRTEEHFVTLLSTGLITVFRLFGGPAFAAPDWLFPEPGRQTDPPTTAPVRAGQNADELRSTESKEQSTIPIIGNLS
jgi:hypothetical protein